MAAEEYSYAAHRPGGERVLVAKSFEELLIQTQKLGYMDGDLVFERIKEVDYGPFPESFGRRGSEKKIKRERGVQSKLSFEV